MTRATPLVPRRPRERRGAEKGVAPVAAPVVAPVAAPGLVVAPVGATLGQLDMDAFVLATCAVVRYPGHFVSIVFNMPSVGYLPPEFLDGGYDHAAFLAAFIDKLDAQLAPDGLSASLLNLIEAQRPPILVIRVRQRGIVPRGGWYGGR